MSVAPPKTSATPFARPPFQITDKVGILDPDGLTQNPLTGKPYINREQMKTIEGEPKTYANIAKYKWRNLGVYTRHAEVLKLMNDKQIVCAKSGTGSGKTVIFPKFALHVGGYQKKVLCAIPKKLITKSSAEWAAITLDVRLGQEVGYFYKGDHNRSNKTLLTFTTTGSVNAIIKRDPLLADYDYLVIDEAHERTVDMDLLLLFVKEMVKVRKDIKVVIMSATIEPKQYQKYFSGMSFGAIDIPALAPFPRVKEYPSQNIKNGTKNAVIQENIVRIISGILDRPPLLHDKHLLQNIEKQFKALGKTAPVVDGDILAFVTSGNAANKIKGALETLAKTKKWPPVFITKLESKSSRVPIRDKRKRLVYLPNEDKNATEEDFAKHIDAYKIHHPDNDEKNPFTRKIVISTDVAESSITIEGATYVIDSGVTLDSGYDPARNTGSLLSKFIARDAIEQRQGRVGRSNPGVCYHLYSQEQYKAFDDITTPEVRKADLTSHILEIMSMEGKDSVAHVRAFFNQLLEPPKEEFIVSALRTLHSLGAITTTDNSGCRNMFGRAMSYFRSPITPAQAKCLIISKYYNCSHEMAELVALLDACGGNLNEFIDAQPSSKGKPPNRTIHPYLVSKYGDHLTMLHCYDWYKKAHNKKQFCRKYKLVESKFATIKEQSTKIWSHLDTLFEREDDLTNTDASLVLDEMNLVERKKKDPHNKNKQVNKQHGGAFTVTDDLKLGTSNPSGKKDLEILYAMYPNAKKNINTIAEQIQQQDDPAVPTTDFNAEKVQALLTSRLQRYNATAFGALAVEDKKAVLSAVDESIQYREAEHRRISKAQEDGKATVAELADAKGHEAWIRQLKMIRAHAVRSYRQEQGELRQARRQRVEDMLYKHIENKPKDFSPNLVTTPNVWDNREMRLMRVLYEGYCLQSAVRVKESDKTFHSVFPQTPTSAVIDGESILNIKELKQSVGDVIVYERIYTSAMGTSYQCVSSLPSCVRRNDEVCDIFNKLTTRLPIGPSTTNSSRVSQPKSQLIRTMKPIPLGASRYTKQNKKSKQSKRTQKRNKGKNRRKQKRTKRKAR